MNILNMRNLLALSVIFSLFSGLTACGQSGALMLPSDPNYDKRAKYLIYPNHPVDKQEQAEIVDKQSTLSSSDLSEVNEESESKSN